MSLRPYFSEKNFNENFKKLLTEMTVIRFHSSLLIFYIQKNIKKSLKMMIKKIVKIFVIN